MLTAISVYKFSLSITCININNGNTDKFITLHSLFKGSYIDACCMHVVPQGVLQTGGGWRNSYISTAPTMHVGHS